jgi:hypothetical protein
LFRLVVTSQSAGPQSMTMTALVSVQAGQVSILQEYLFYKL